MGIISASAFSKIILSYGPIVMSIEVSGIASIFWNEIRTCFGKDATPAENKVLLLRTSVGFFLSETYYLFKN